MTDFHPQTVAGLRYDLDKWREVLDNAARELRYREERVAEARGQYWAASSRVADYERLLAVAEANPDAQNAPTDAYDDCLPEQLDGTACINCAQDFTEGQRSKLVDKGPRGPLFAHSNPGDCLTDTEERAL